VYVRALHHAYSNALGV